MTIILKLSPIKFTFALIFSCTIIASGIIYSRQFMLRKIIVNDILSFIRFCNNQIEFRRNRLLDIFESYKQYSSSKFNIILDVMIKNLKNNSKLNNSEILDKMKVLNLSQDCIQTFMSLISQIGTSDYVVQKNILEYTSKLYQEYYEFYKLEYSKKYSSYIKLSILIGILVFILII